jgi:hypothetical protein
MLDLSVAYHRYRFVGHEFLTWLWFVLEQEPRKIEIETFAGFSARIGNRMVLENTYHQSTETLIIKGEDVGLEEAMLSLKKGGMISEMNLIVSSDRQQWQLTVKGEGLTVSGLKILDTMEKEPEEDQEAILLDRIATCEQVMEWLFSVFRIFLKTRLSDDWDRQVIVDMRRWISDRE